MAWSPVSPELQGMNPLGVALANSVMAGGSPVPQMQAPQMPGMKKPSKGQMILGILGDALAGAAGRAPVFAQHLGQMRAEERQDQRQQAQWGLQRRAGLEDYEARQQIEQRYRAPDVSPMERDARAWANMTPELQTAYRAAQAAKPQFIPDGLGGGQWVQPTVPGSAPRPAGPPPGVTFTPLPAGGPTPKASGNFPR
jgi:hypothetical protein